VELFPQQAIACYCARINTSLVPRMAEHHHIFQWLFGNPFLQPASLHPRHCITAWVFPKRQCEVSGFASSDLLLAQAVTAVVESRQERRIGT
jgi:hypothetical protein